MACNFCEKSFFTDRGLTVHTSRMHKEEFRKKERNAHNTDFSLERKKSVTKSPPSKKAKEMPETQNKVVLTQMTIKKNLKDEEILRLNNIILQLQNGLLCKERKSEKRHEVLDPVINLIKVVEVEEIQPNQGPPNEPTQKIGKNRQNPKYPSEKTTSICSHRQNLILEDIPEFGHTCNKCGKGFREKANLLEHMTCHTKRFCE